MNEFVRPRYACTSPVPSRQLPVASETRRNVPKYTSQQRSRMCELKKKKKREIRTCVRATRTAFRRKRHGMKKKERKKSKEETEEERRGRIHNYNRTSSVVIRRLHQGESLRTRNEAKWKKKKRITRFVQKKKNPAGTGSSWTDKREGG